MSQYVSPAGSGLPVVTVTVMSSLNCVPPSPSVTRMVTSWPGEAGLEAVGAGPEVGGVDRGVAVTVGGGSGAVVDP